MVIVPTHHNDLVLYQDRFTKRRGVIVAPQQKATTIGSFLSSISLAEQGYVHLKHQLRITRRALSQPEIVRHLDSLNIPTVEKEGLTREQLGPLTYTHLFLSSFCAQRRKFDFLYFVLSPQEALEFEHIFGLTPEQRQEAIVKLEHPLTQSLNSKNGTVACNSGRRIELVFDPSSLSADWLRNFQRWVAGSAQPPAEIICQVVTATGNLKIGAVAVPILPELFELNGTAYFSGQVSTHIAENQLTSCRLTWAGQGYYRRARIQVAGWPDVMYLPVRHHLDKTPEGLIKLGKGNDAHNLELYDVGSTQNLFTENEADFPRPGYLTTVIPYRKNKPVLRLGRVAVGFPLLLCSSKEVLLEEGKNYWVKPRRLSNEEVEITVYTDQTAGSKEYVGEVTIHIDDIHDPNFPLEYWT